MFNYTTDRVPSPPYRENQLKPELLGFSALNPFAGYNSSPRSSMFSKHVGQCLVVAESEPRRIQTGVEREIGKNTFSVKFDNNSYIVKVIDKFPYTMGKHHIGHSPMKAVIFENHDHPDLEVDILYLPDYKCDHHFFGFDYEYDKSVMSRIKPGARIPAGTKVADSPNVKPNGDYAYGINANVILGSHPCGIEDGVLMSESFANKLKTKIYETRTFSFGEGILPLNTYGNNEVYKIFPDIGERVRDDGVICALREFNPELAPCDLSVRELQNVTPFDKRQYAEPGSIVIDVTVVKGSGNRNDVFTDMDTQAAKYHERHMQFYREIIDTYESLRKGRGGHLPISHEFHRVLVEGMKMLAEKAVLHKKRKRIPPWTVTVTTMTELDAANGFKITDTHGGKSVTVKIAPDDQMPYDDMGNVADLIVDDKSTIKRLIKGKLHEHYIAACMRDESTRIKRIAEDYPNGIPDNVYAELWERILGFYKIVSPPFYELIGEIKPDIKEHVDNVIRDGMYLYLPTDNPVCYLDVARLLREHYPACNAPVNFIDMDGKPTKTVNKVIIGQIYYILLEKVANDFSAVSSAKLQHYGLPAKPSGESRYGEPIKMTPVRFGESEYRLFAATVGGENLAELADRSTNILVHDEILKNLLEAKQPTNVYNLVDRKEFPVGQGFIQKVIHHSLRTLGVEIVKGGDGPYSELK